MHRLDCHVQTYDWGKRGNTSEVARLFAAGHKHFKVDLGMSYAELWMGTHPDGPARLQGTQMELSQHRAARLRQQHPEDHLPFIMKIMSIRHTLSLQVHPTKEQAAYLHKKDPYHYPDRNHKPELAYALTRFELLCGFRPAEEIVQNMKAFPEMTLLMGEDNCKVFEKLLDDKASQDSEEFKDALRECFTNMIYIENESTILMKCLGDLKKHLADGVRGALSEDTVGVMEKTIALFPHDVGCFAPLYLNHMILEPGECCFYAAEELHAYLSGECVECVGCSNNTIRAGLTRKYVDRDSLVEVLNYRMTEPSFYLVPPTTIRNNVVEYAPDCKDFTLHEIKLSLGQPSSSVANLPTLDCGSILVIVSGTALLSEVEDSGIKRRTATRGDIFYLPEEAEINLECLGNEDVLAYRTFSFEDGPDHWNRIRTGSLSSAEHLKHKLKEEEQRKMDMMLNNNNNICKDDSGINISVENQTSLEMDGFV